MNKLAYFSAAVLASLACVSLAQNDPAANQRQQSQPQDQAGQRQDPDQMFVRHAADDNQFEIQLAQFVEQRSQDQQVKKLAQQIIQDHQQAQQQLRQVAQSMNVQISDQLMPVHQAMLEEFQKKQGEMLDRAYTFDQVGDHMKDLLKYRYEAQHAQNPQLKQYAEQTVRPLEHHLEMARTTAEQWVPEARTAGEHIRGRSSESGTPRQPGGTSGTETQTPGGTR